MLNQVHPRSKRLLMIVVPAVGLIAGGVWLLCPLPAEIPSGGSVPLRPGVSAADRMTGYVDPSNFQKALAMYAELTGRTARPSTLTPLEKVDEFLDGKLTQLHLLKPRKALDTGITWHRDGRWSAGEIKEQLEEVFAAQGFTAVPSGHRSFSLVRDPSLLRNRDATSPQSAQGHSGN